MARIELARQELEPTTLGSQYGGADHGEKPGFSFDNHEFRSILSFSSLCA